MPPVSPKHLSKILDDMESDDLKQGFKNTTPQIGSEQSAEVTAANAKTAKAIQKVAGFATDRKPADDVFFIIGGYGAEKIEQLQLVKSKLDSRENGHPFLLADIDANVKTRVAFQLAADFSDYIVAVVEESTGGIGLELGELMESSNYEKTFVLKREYSSPSEEREAFDHPTSHFFKLINEDGRLYKWKTESELEDLISQIPGGNGNEE